jgi:CHAT domain-containing protein/Tfp pilus assembly protein PilF
VALLALVASSSAGLAMAQEPLEPVSTLRDLLASGHLLEAEERARTQLPRAEAAAGPDSIAIAARLDVLVESRLRQWFLTDPSVHEWAERALVIKKRALSANDPRLVPSLVNRATVAHFNVGYGAAIPLFERALRIAESAGPRRHELMGNTLLGLALAQRDAGATDKALELFEDALLHQRAAFGHRHPGVARVLNELASTKMTLLQSDEARSLLREAVSIVEENRLAEHPLGVAILVREAIRCANEANAEDAGVLLASVYETGVAKLGPGHPLVARIHEGMGAVARRRGDLDRSVAEYEAALQGYEKHLGARHQRLLTVLQVLAWLHYEEADHAKARRYLSRARRIAESSFGPGHPRRVATYNTYGLFLRQIGDYERARRVFETLVADCEARGAAMESWRMAGLANLAATAHAAGKLEDADELYEEITPYFERVYGREHRFGQLTLLMHGALQVQLGRLDRGKAMLGEALETGERIFGRGHPRVADACEQLAIVEVKTGDPGLAKEHLERALAIREKVNGPMSAKVGGTLVLLARLLAGRGELEGAITASLRAEEIGRRSLRLTARVLPERQALRYARVRNRGLDVALSVLARDRALAQSHAREVWDDLVRSRAAVLDEMAARNRTLGDLDSAEDRARLDELDDVRVRLANLVVRGAAGLAGSRSRELHERLLSRKEDLENRLAESSEALRRDLSLQRTGLEDAIANLPAETALVSYVSYVGEPVALPQGEAERSVELEDIGASPAYSTPFEASARRERQERSYLAFVRSARRGDVAVVPLGDADHIDALVAAWLVAVGKRPGAMPKAWRVDEGNYADTASRLRRAIWDPVAEHLSGGKQAFVVPAGSLHSVNFSTLWDSSGRYLLHSGPAFHYLSAERDLLLRHEGDLNDGLLALGGIDFDARVPRRGRSELSRPPSSEERAATGTRGIDESCRRHLAGRFAALPGSDREIGEIVGAWRSHHPESEQGEARVLEVHGKEASERLFKRESPRYRVLHLATHAFFVPEHCLAQRVPDLNAGNPLLTSGIVLAGANLRTSIDGGENDGMLTAEEVAGLDLSGVEWAVLSACETGGGVLMNGEGVLGLRRAFQIAGVRALIMSLWPVEDEVTRQWMRELYEARLDGASTAEALQRASLNVLESRRSAGQSTHPFYWGAFVASGDWR